MANAFHHEKDRVFALAPGGDRIIDRHGSPQSEPPAALAQPKLPRLIDGFDQHLERAAVVLKTEMAWHCGTTRGNTMWLPLRGNIAEA